MNTLKQTSTPLNTTFFSPINVDIIQKTIRHKFREESNLAIDRQNDTDLFTLMRAVFIQYGLNPYGNVCEQVRSINEEVVKQALVQIRTGVSQYMTYIRDMDKPMTPLNLPESTTTYGLSSGPQRLKL
tara:strand:- start:5875 stop:6258 length:384 start_codon:yes stop_codon:yes gene_type:complete